MIHLSVAGLLLTLLVSQPSGQAQKKAPTDKQKPPTSFTEKMLKFLGISNSPGTLKAPGDVTSGEIWLADLQAMSTRALTSSDSYRSPIFLAGNKDVLALRGDDVVRAASSASGEVKKLYAVSGILKLVGVSSEDSATVLILLRGEAGGHPRVGLLTVGTGAVTPVPYDPASGQDLQMVENLGGWLRTYGDRQIYVRKQSKQALSGTVEWSDVFLQVEGQPSVDVSQCDGVNCGQPSLSPDGHWLVFVRTKGE
jgi:hypothetical protein